MTDGHHARVFVIEDSFSNQSYERASMGEVIQFIPKSERERTRLVREASAIYGSIFPPADPINGQRDKAPASHTVSSASARCSDGIFLS